MELAFAGVHQLCAPLLDLLEGRPAPQRHALGIAFALRPLLCLVDDAQWLDRTSAQVLAQFLRDNPYGLKLDGLAEMTVNEIFSSGTLRRVTCAPSRDGCGPRTRS
jgi:hypothetical protein